jgi:hypothetical protein
MGRILDRYSLVLGAALTLLCGVGVGYGAHGMINPPGLEERLNHRIGLLDLNNLKPRALQRLYLSDIKDDGLRALGLRDLKDERLKKIRLSELREGYLERIPLDTLRDHALDELTVADIRDADWIHNPADSPTPLVAKTEQGTEKSLVAEQKMPAAMPVIPLHTPGAKKPQPKKPAVAAKPKPAPRVASRATTSPRVAYRPAPAPRRYVATRVYPTPKRRVAVERDVAFGSGVKVRHYQGRTYIAVAPDAMKKPGKFKKFGKKVKTFFRNMID